ncbi:MAG: hypothetical protein DRO67_10030 [Candidatus Asgardarchaeum californiense]|nr:MAG: hypothetical protein DRO67_10030 [Candidatus Asgardarchaeum californiense]
MNTTLLRNNLRSKGKSKVIWISLLVPVLLVFTAWMAFKSLYAYPSVDSIYNLTIQLSLLCIVPLGVILSYWDQEKVIRDAQMTLTKPITRLNFFVGEYFAGAGIIYLLLLFSGMSVSIVSYYYGYFSWKIILAFCSTLPTVLLSEGTMLLISLLFSYMKALIIGMALCCGGLFRLSIGAAGKALLGISGIEWILPNLQFGMFTSMNCIYKDYIPPEIFMHSFFIWLVELVIVCSIDYFLFKRRDL